MRRIERMCVEGRVQFKTQDIDGSRDEPLHSLKYLLPNHLASYPDRSRTVKCYETPRLGQENQ